MFEFSLSIVIPLILRSMEDDNRILSFRNVIWYIIQFFLVLYWIDTYFVVNTVPQIKEFIAGLTMFQK